MTDIDKLLSLEEIRLLKYKYFRGIDTKDYDLLVSIYHPDIEVDFRDAAVDTTTGKTYFESDITGGVLRGRETAARSAVEVMSITKSAHHGHNPEIEFTSDDTATGLWAMMDLVRYNGGVPAKELKGYGYYHETYVRVDGAWKIKSIKLTRTFVDFIE